ncbi:MAG: GNAT family N-acetyltransferase [Clostridia bacterium]|nr:GNAT family N-acetyltransferase [Clostridia bacterium]
MLTFRKAVPGDMDALLALYEQGRKAIARFGIDQWQNGYPARADVEKDMADDVLWVSEDPEMPGKPASVMALIFTGEPTYDVITEGEWLTGDSHNYAAIHRITVSPDFRNRGVAGQTMAFGMESARKAGFSSLRIDTHKGNLAMRGMLEKNGFTHCGTIFLESGAPRVAYEILL